MSQYQPPYWKPRRAGQTEPNHLSLENNITPSSPFAAPDEQSLTHEQARLADTFYRLDKTENVIRFLYGLLTWLLCFRILLQHINANADKLLVQIIYLFTLPFMIPFEEIAPTISVGPLVVDFAGVVAIFFYRMLSWGVIRLMWLLLYHPGRPPKPIKSRKEKDFQIR